MSETDRGSSASKRASSGSKRARGGTRITKHRPRSPTRTGARWVSVGTPAEEDSMRIESSVTAISWIPRRRSRDAEAPVRDRHRPLRRPPPDRLEEGDLERLRDADRFREANVLKAWIEVEDGAIVGHGQEGERPCRLDDLPAGLQGSDLPGSRVRGAPARAGGPGDSVRFVQTVGGRAGFPAPRRVRGRPFFRIHSATAWTTLALTIRADGASEPRGRRSQPVPAPLDLRQGRGPRPRSREQSTSRPGTARRMARTRPGATRNRKRS